MNNSDRPKDIGLPESASTSVNSASDVEPASSVLSAHTVKPASDIESADSVQLSEVSVSTVEPASSVKSAGKIDEVGARNEEEPEEDWNSDSEPVKPNMRPRGGVKQPVSGGGGSKK